MKGPVLRGLTRWGDGVLNALGKREPDKPDDPLACIHAASMLLLLVWNLERLYLIIKEYPVRCVDFVYS